jgi:hypothetical protein
MTSSERFPYVSRDPTLGMASLAPMAPLTFVARENIVTTGLVDSGAAINVLPFALGIQLGFEWDKQTSVVSELRPQIMRRIEQDGPKSPNCSSTTASNGNGLTAQSLEQLEELQSCGAAKSSVRGAIGDPNA